MPAPITDHRTIAARHWQLRMGWSAPAFGDIVTGYDDLAQCINTIVLTEKGTVPGQPEKCTRLMPWIDRRPDYAIPNITREIFDAIRLWEPRIVVEQVRITREDFDHWRFPVFWYARADVTRDIRRTDVALPLSRQPGVSGYAA